MIPIKRRSSQSSQTNSPPSSRNSPAYSQLSPPYGAAMSPSHSRPMTTAAAAAAALKRGQAPIPRRPSSGNELSRQGSVEAEQDSTPQPSQQEEQDDSTQQPKDDGENDDDEKDEVVVDLDAHMQAQMEKAKEDMKLLLENFSSDQLLRYEGYRRSALNRTNVKRLVAQVLNQQCSPTMAFVVAGFTKVYVGEIIEKAREVMDEWGHTGAIRPDHLREAQRRYKKEELAESFVGRKLMRR